MSPLPQTMQTTQPQRVSEHIIVECCRKCSFKYVFSLENGQQVTIICGRPDPSTEKYKTLSYVWEDTMALPLKCRKCLQTTTIPMRDDKKFRRIMEFLGGETTVWIDALSIDQSDPKDKAAQLPVMGNIYRHANVVSVLLVDADNLAYQMLTELSLISSKIVSRRDALEAAEIDKELDTLADDFQSNLVKWIDSLQQWRYWRRAWTFQEWAMARELEITYESAPRNARLKRFKNVIVEASSLLGQLKKSRLKSTNVSSNAEDLLHQVHIRDDMGFQLNAVRCLFPFQGFLVADNGEDIEKMRSSTFLTPLPLATDSGTYVDTQVSRQGPGSLRSLLGLTLSAMGTSLREASHEADLVACWASACNIKYDYNELDTLPVALHKAIYAIRAQGITVYNFLANTTSAETDVSFLNYAAPHHQTNSRSRGRLFGAPIFIGRADTHTHLFELLGQSETITHLPAKKNVTLQAVDKAVLKRPVSWSNKARAMGTFRSMISGKADGVRLFDVADGIEAAIDAIHSQDKGVNLAKRLLITVSIGANDFNTMWYFNAWAIIPSTTPLQDLFVARENLNGTLVLAICKAPERDLQARPYTREDPRESATKAQIVAYLNMTHQRDGTYLVKCDDRGVIDIVFRTEDNPEHEIFRMPEGTIIDLGGEGMIPNWGISDAMSDRVLGLQISLENKFFSLPKQIFQSSL